MFIGIDRKNEDEMKEKKRLKLGEEIQEIVGILQSEFNP